MLGGLRLCTILSGEVFGFGMLFRHTGKICVRECAFAVRARA